MFGWFFFLFKLLKGKLCFRSLEVIIKFVGFCGLGCKGTGTGTGMENDIY